MSRPFHIHLSSLDSQTRFPTNTGSDFRVQLPEELTLPRGEWTLGLTAAHLSSLPETPVFICSDICEETVVGEKKLPVLALITEKQVEPSHVVYLRLKTESLKSIRIYLTDRSGEKLSEPVSTLYCTLHFFNHEASWDSS